MAKAGRRTGADSTSTPSARGEALAALQLWQTFEYLSPQTPPKPKVDDDICIWTLDPHAEGDRQMPWVASDKMQALNKYFKRKRRFMLYAGVIDGAELVETARALLDAPALDFSEQRAPANAASFVIPIDERGHVSGDVFISTVPWAIACIKAARDRGGLFNFSGFFGEGGVQQRVKQAVEELLKLRQLIETDPTEKSAESPTEKPEVDTDIAGDMAAAEDPFAEEPGSTIAEASRLRTLDAGDVRAIAEVVFSTCGWAPTETPVWTVQTQRASAKDEDRTPDDPLNSFYAEELEKVQGEYLAGRCGSTLTQYLETPIHPERCDLEGNRRHLVEGVHPSLTPQACWPGEHPLVTAQQFAVNTIMRDLRKGGLYAVNGPPGTGKTTMLKDLLAAIVVERADALESFANPLHAFPRRLDVEGHGFPVWKLHDRLRGFGIVVACANNGAAENISKDLPGFGAKDKNLELDYFSEVADSLGLAKGKKKRPQQRWGLVSAALGRQDKKLAFASDFWLGRKSDEVKAKAGTTGQEGVSEEPAPPPDPLRPFTLQEWVAEFGATVPPWDEACEAYRQAKERAAVALTRAGTLADQMRANEELAPRLELLRARQAELEQARSQLAQRQAQAESAVAAAGGQLERARTVAAALRTLAQRRTAVQVALEKESGIRKRQPAHSIEDVVHGIARSERARARVKEDMVAHERDRPGAVSAFFRKANLQQWMTRRDRLAAELDAERQQQSALEVIKDQVALWQRELSAAQGLLEAAQSQQQSAQAAVQVLKVDAALSLDEAIALLREAEDGFKRQGEHLQGLQRRAGELAGESRAVATEMATKSAIFISNTTALDAAGLLDDTRVAWRLYEAPRDDFHRASPYHDEAEIFQARRDLFAAALALHKAFVVHAWQRVKPTLFASIGLVTGRISPNQVPGGPMALWDALFLVVPLLSTTFASFPRVFRGVGKEELAWVLIDEAGQAAPQYCAGALWRAKRAVIVGDPLQLEPVVDIPVELAAPLRARCGADMRYVPPEASAQTLADLSNRYGMYLNEGDPERRLWLGAPLIVHRRCINPMFEIANAIAYEGKMVYGAGTDRPGHTAPWSRWLDAATESNVDHWIPEQANRALTAVKKLVRDQPRAPDGKLRAFVITPFKEVAKKMQRLLAEEYGLDDAEEMCGTVHTFQGREADYVIFLLGGDPHKPGVISHFAGRTANLINVAVTRAKKRVYVLGNLDFWTGSGDCHGYFGRMARTLEKHASGMKAKRMVDQAVAAGSTSTDG